MKRLLLMLAFMMLFTFSARAQDTYAEQYEASGAEELYGPLSDTAADFMEELEIDLSDPSWTEKLTFENIWKQISDFIQNGASAPLKCGAAMLAVIILTAAASTFDFFKAYGDVASYIFVLASAAGVLLPMFSLIQSCASAIKGISTLMSGFVPLYAGILTASGQAATASGMNFLLLAASAAVSGLSSFVIVPLMSCYLGVGMMGSLMPEFGTNRLGEGIKKAAMWTLSITLTLFLGVLSVQTAVNKAADNLGLKTVRFVIGSFVPVAGGALSESLTTLLGSVKLLKTSVGMFGVVAVAATVLPVVTELILWRLTLFVLDIAAELFGVRMKTEVLRTADCVLATLVGVLLFTAALFIISLAVISGGG